jgi:pimeloyl-ACP methyl ester carboxylesterase
MQSVTHDGRETAYRETQPDSDGPGLLYIHGSGGTHQLWAYEYGPKGPSHPAVAIDLSGHGASDDISTEIGHETLDAYADDVIAVAKATDSSVLVGNSLGGAIVQHILLERDFDPSAAMLVGSGAKLGVAESLQEVLANDFEKAVAVLHGDDYLFHDPDEQVLEQSKQTMHEVGQAVLRRDFMTCNEFDVRDRVDEIDVPVLAVTGEYDQLTPPMYHEFLADEIPEGQMALIEDAAHLSMAEQPVAFTETVRTFLSERAGVS